MKAQLFPSSCVGSGRALLVAGLLCLASLPAAAQPESNVGAHLGTFSVGEIQWPLTARVGGVTCAGTWEVVSGQLPPGVTLRTDVPSWHGPEPSAILMGIATTPAVYPFTLRVTCAGAGALDQPTQLDIVALTIVDLDRLPDGFANTAYSHSFTAAGATGDMTWEPDQPWPDGLALSSGGVLSWDDPVQGSHSVGIKVSDSSGTVRRTFGLNVHGSAHLTSTLLPNASPGVAYSAQVAATGGTGPYAFTISGGSLPSGLSMDGTGLITGIPANNPGRYPLWITMTDAAASSHGREVALYVVAAPPGLPLVQPHGNVFDDCTLGVPCLLGITVPRGGTPPFTWTVEGLPTGFALRTGTDAWPAVSPGDAAIVGVGTAAGTYAVQVTATGADGVSGTHVIPLKVSPLALRTEPTHGSVDQPFSSKLFVLGGNEPSATIAAGPLPAGVSFNPATSTLTGTPLEAGGFHVAVRAADGVDALNASLHVGIGDTSTIYVHSGWDLGTTTPGASYSNQLWACCVATTLTWSVVGGTLPPGLELFPDGRLSGQATTAGVFTFLVQATDSATPANFARRQLTLNVSPLVLSMNSQLATGFVTASYSAPLTLSGATGAVTWSVARYSLLPPGLSLTEDNGAWALSGTPATSGRYDFTLQGRDEAGHTLTWGFGVSVYPSGVTPPVTIDTAPDFGTWSVGSVGVGLFAGGGNGTYVWSLEGGELPPGIALRSDVPAWYGPAASAALMGIATTPGTYAFTLRATSGGVHWDRAFTARVTALRVTSRGGLPDAFVGEPYSATLDAAGGAGPVSWTAQGALPPGLTLSGAGILSGTPTAAGTYGLNVVLTDGVDSVGRWLGINVFDVHLTTDVLPSATRSLSYSAQLTASGGSEPHTFTVSGLPGGLTMTSAGAIAGTVSWGAGRFGFTAWVTDSEGRTHSRNLAIFVTSAPPTLPRLLVHGGAVDDCTVFADCSRSFYVASGGIAPYTWTASGLPPGLSLVYEPAALANGATPGDAELTGVPTTPGTYLVRITATGADGTSGTQDFPLTVSSLGLWTDNIHGSVGAAFAASLCVVGGTGPYTGTIVGGKLPAGLAYDGSSRVTGTPLESGHFPVRLHITDEAGHTLNASAHLHIDGSPSTVNVNSHWDLGDAYVTSAYWRQMQACCAPGYVWTHAGGTLPPGLSVSPDGVLSGTATTAGTYTFLLRATDSTNPANVGAREFRLTVTPLSVSAAVGMGTGNVATPYSLALTATGATGAVTWTVAPFSHPPPGLTLVSDAGAWTLSGTPTASGEYPFVLVATDEEGHSARLAVTLSFYPPGVTPPVRIMQSPNAITQSVGDFGHPLVAAGGDGTYSWAVIDGSLPPGVSLRVRPDIAPWYSPETSAEISGIATAPGTYTFTLRVTSGSTVADRVCVVTITALRSTDPYQLPEGFVGRPYSYSLGAAGNAGPVTFTLNNPNQPLPPGLTMDEAGVISGTPSVAGYFYVDYAISDGSLSVGRRLNLSVFDLAITSPARLPNATQYAAYSTQVEASGGVPPYSFTHNGGLPNGLLLDAASGTIAGTVNAGPGNYGFWLTVTDATEVSYSRMTAINVVGVPKRLPSIGPHGSAWNDCTFGVPCSAGLWVSQGGTAPFTWSATGLPDGMTIRAADGSANSWLTPGDGEISGVPAELGAFAVQVTVTDADGATATNTFPLRVSRLMARDFDGSGTRGEAFEAYPFPTRYRRIRILGGEYSGYPSYASVIVGGQLPLGLSLDPNTQIVSGTPIEDGHFNITLDVTDAGDPANSLRTSQGLHIGGGTSTISINQTDLGVLVIGQDVSIRLNACCVPTGYTWSVEPGWALPAGLALSGTGRITGQPAGPAGPASFLVRAADAINPANYGIRLLTLRLLSSAIVVSSSSSLPFANVGDPYTQTLVATGGSGALTWTLEANNYLPPGLSISTGGVLGGTPTRTGQFSFALRVSDTAGNFAVRTFTLEVFPAGQVPPLGLNVGRTYRPQLGAFTIELSQASVTGGVGPYTFSLTPGADLPAGTAQIDGMRVQNGPPFPTYFSSSALAGYMGVIAEPGEYHPSIRVTDSRGVSADWVLTVTVPPIAVISSPTPPRATVGVFYLFTLEPYGGSGNYTWSAVNLPAGLSIDRTTGEISGTPAATGAFSPSITMTDPATGTSASIGLTLRVDPYAIETNGSLPPAMAGSAYSTMLVAPGCGPTCSWSITSGSLTNGLSLNPTTGVISGTNPVGPDSRTFTVRAAVSQGSATFAEKVFSMVTQHAYYAALVITNGVAPGDVTVGSVTSLGLTATGGTPPYVWMLDAGELPPGITLVASAERYSGLYGPGMHYLRGRAMVAGTYTFTLRATDYAGATATKTITWNVSRLSFQYANLPVGSTPLRYDEFYTQPLLVLGGTGEYPTWSSVTQMPPGLSVAANTGIVSGTPTATGSFNRAVLVADSVGNTFVQGVNFNIAGPTQTMLTFPFVGTVFTPFTGSSVSYNVTPAGGTGPYTVTAVTPLPPGFALVRAEDSVIGGPASGVSLMGVALSPAPITFTLEARDSATPTPNVGARTFTLSPLAFNTVVGSSLPDASVGEAFSQPLVVIDNTGTSTWSVAPGSTLPPGLTLSAGDTISGTPTQAGLYYFALIVSDQSGLTITRNVSLKVSPIAIAGANVLPVVTTGVPYSHTFTATGGSGPLTWSLASGTLPAGLSLSSGGVLSGTRTSGSGSTALMVTATDGTSSVTRRVLLPTVLPNPAVLSVAMPVTALEVAVGQSLGAILSTTVSGGSPPYTFSVAPGSTLPPGMRLISGPGLSGYNVGSTMLAGLAGTAGHYAFDLIVTDAVGSQVRRTFTLTVTPIALVGNLALTHTVGQSGSSRFAAVGGAPPYTFTIEPVSPTQDMLPPGVSMTADGVLSGAPTSTGGYAFWLTVQDAVGSRLRRQVTLTVNTATGLRVTTVNPNDVWVGGYLHRSLATNLTTSTVSWSLAGGSLPPGVSIVRGLVPTSPDTTFLTGAPTAPGTYTFTLRATADSGTAGSADHTFTCRVGSAQIVSPPWGLANVLDIPGAEAGAPYTFAFRAAGANPPYTFAPAPFDPLPPGLSLSAAGVLSGTPQSSGAYSISVVVTDGAGYTNLIAGLALIVAPAGQAPPLVLSGSLIGPASVGVPYGYGLDIMLRGGTPPFSWTVSPGSSLPPGMKLLPGSNGVPTYLGGTPTAPGSYAFYLTTTDSGGQSLSAVYNLTVTDLALLPDAPPPGLVGAAYAHAFVPSGGTAPYSVERSYASDLPPGLSFASGGVISGTPVSPGIYTIRMLVIDAAGASLTRIVPIVVDDAMGQSPAVVVSPRPVEVFHDIGAAAPAPVPVTVATTSGAVPAALAVAGVPGAVLSTTSGPTPLGSSLSFDTSSLGAGVYTGIVAAAAPGTVNIGDWVPVTLTVCAHTLFPQAASVPASGGTGTFNVASGSTCTWTALASASWITITGGGSGTGGGAVNYSLAPNDSADPRTGTITVNGAVYTITQFGSACTYVVNPATGSVGHAGGAGVFAVSTNGACGWTATSSETWLTITSGASGTGNATIAYSATVNPDPALRSATITVNGAVHTVMQFGTSCAFAINPTSVTATASGGTATVSVSASSSQCGWTAESVGLGVTPAAGVGSGALQVAVPVNPLSESRWLSATIAGQPFSVYQTGIACAVSLSSASASAPAGASGGSVDVATPEGCSYDTVLGPSWISVTSGASGVGPGTLSFVVEPNSTTYARTGTLSIGGQAFTITQAPLACSVTLNTATLGSPFGSLAGTGAIALAVNGPNCSWAASSDSSWAAVTPSAGSGNATLTVSVGSNALSTIARSGALTIAGQTVGISQAGTACSYALESSSGAASASGGSASVRVIAPTVCGWAASSLSPWLTITSSGSAGTSAVSFSVAPNPSATARSGELTIAGLTYALSQAGAPCAYSLTGSSTSPLLSAGGAAGETFAFAATTTGCSPAAVSYSSWIAVTATSFDGAAGSVTYSVAPNAFGTTRTGTIQVGNALFTVNQTGADCAFSLNAYGKVFGVEGGADVLLGSPTAVGCVPVCGTDQPSFVTLGTLTGPELNVFSLPYEVSPFTTSLTAVVRIGRITFGGQALTIKQLSW